MRCFIPGLRNRAKFVSENYNRDRFSSMFENRNGGKDKENGQAE